MRTTLIYCCGIVLLLLAAAGCKKIGVYEKHASFTAFNWNQQNTPGFEFEISDSVSPYNIFLVCRHTDAYAYSNLWVNITEFSPGGDSLSRDIQIPLTVNNKEWAGAGMDDIFEARYLPAAFKARPMKKGLYRYRVRHIMRDEPLKQIMNFGMRIEKINS
jgi:gliding motility-associated lipoprotein GldH